MTLGGIEYSAQFVDQQGDTCIYRIDEWSKGRMTRTFTGRISATQRATAREGQNSDSRSIEHWCELHPQLLPEDGGTVDIDLKSLML